MLLSPPQKGRGYIQLILVHRQGCMLANWQDNLLWKPHIFWPMRRVTINISKPNTKMAWTNDLKNFRMFMNLKPPIPVYTTSFTNYYAPSWGWPHFMTSCHMWPWGGGQGTWIRRHCPGIFYRTKRRSPIRIEPFTQLYGVSSVLPPWCI